MSLLRLAIVSLALLTASCGWFSREDPATKPAELTEYSATAELDRLWSRNVGESADELPSRLGPAVADGVVYVANREGQVTALAAESGDRRWRTETELNASAGPGVGEGLLVLGGLDGELVALDAASGEERWRARVTSEVLSAPAIRGNRVVVRCIDGRVFGFDRATGARQWVHDHSVPLLTLRGTGDPVIRAGVVLLGLDNGRVVALNVDDGSVIWEQQLAAPEGRTELERMVDVDGHISVVATEVYAASFQGSLAAMSLDSGQPLWEREVSSWQGVAARRTQLFLTDARSHVWTFDRRNGASGWKQEALENRRLSTPAVIGSYVIVGDLEGYVHVIDVETGNLAGRAHAGDGPVDVAPIVDGGIAFVMTREGDLSAYRVGPR